MVISRRYPEYFNLSDPSTYVSEVVAKLRNGERLCNKYLYLESTGAKNWENVESHLGLKINEEGLLDSHFEKIDQCIRDDSGEGLYDIVSLGCGTGTDDVKILNIAETRNDQRAHCSIITIDLSVRLLEKGTSIIFRDIDKRARLDNFSVLGICCDFESLTVATNIIKERRKNKIALFHLLGLTIGNYKEHNLLRKISSVMEENDYLLISVDLSAEDEKLLKLSMKNYNEGDASIHVDNFLLGPLNLATQYEKTAKDIMFRSYVNCAKNKINYSLSDFSPKLIKSSSERNDYKQYSDIKDTVALTRYYQFGKKEDNRILCDYSNKYSNSGFKNFLSTLYAYNIHLIPVHSNIFTYGQDEELSKKHEPFQTLILLKKTHPKTQVEEVDRLIESIRSYTQLHIVRYPSEVGFLQIYLSESEQKAIIKAKLAVESIDKNKILDPTSYKGDKFIEFYNRFIEYFGITPPKVK